MITTTAANKDENILEEKVNGRNFLCRCRRERRADGRRQRRHFFERLCASNGKEIERTMKKRHAPPPSAAFAFTGVALERGERTRRYLSQHRRQNPNASKKIKELTSLSPIESSSRSDSNSSSEIIERRSALPRRSTPPKWARPGSTKQMRP